MSPRKPTIDGLDDVDDEDGIVEEEAGFPADLSLVVREADEVGLGGAPAGDMDADASAVDDEER
ncbi:MAG: hypothetical protein M3Q93_01045 [Gemmatimonadota bacterium]|nr:hypothetical protein [Gemmatimonadota bacterium]